MKLPSRLRGRWDEGEKTLPCRNSAHSTLTHRRAIDQFTENP